MKVRQYLLDTHLLYWWMTNDAKLGSVTTALISGGNISVSVVTLWEMILKNRKGKLPLPDTPLEEAMQEQGFMVLPLEPRHLEGVRHLKGMHDDPFDRLLVATAAVERRVLLTRDAAILASGFDYVERG